jgi:TolB-like protein/Tfp pilus assembly protein PilF
LVFRFNQVTLDTAQYRLCLAGSPISVEPQVFDLLAYLLENRNRVVTRGELLGNLWKDKVVTDSALGARIKDARKAVGDSGDRQEVIKTFHGRGYQFIAEVSTDPHIAQTTAASDSLAPSLPDKPSVAILPFENLGEENASDYFADGLTRDISTNLCRYRELLVIDSHSAFEYREGYSTIENFARQLGAHYLVSGSIRQAGNRIRISAQLVEAASGRMIWGDNFERAYEDVFTLEDEVAASIASSLASHIEDESIARMTRKPTDSMSAFDCVLRARQYQDSYARGEITAARELLERAIELDSRYAAAYACLAHTYVMEAEADWCSARQEVLMQATELLRKAISLGEFDSFTHMVMGWAYMYLEKFELAEVHLDRAIDCNPNDYDAYCIKSWLLAFTGRGAEVTVCGARALQLNPLAPDQCLIGIATARYTEGDYLSALEMLERVGDPYDQSEALHAACLVQLGRDTEARRAAARAVDLGGEFLQRKEWSDLWPFKHPGDREHFLDGLYKAGVLKDSASLAEKPSVAVLQFLNLSNDPGQRYFSDGMTTNICSRLSRIRSLKVKSAVGYDPAKSSLSEISRELDVAYLLGGSVQREGDKVRVFVELTDGNSGEMKWSEHFDRRGRDVIDIQDDVAKAITATLWSNKGAIREAERDKLAKKPTSDFNAFDYILKGISYKEKFDTDALVLAHECFAKAIELDPDSAEAYGWKAWVYLLEILLGSTANSNETLTLAFAAARKSIAIDAYSEIGHWALGEAYLTDGDNSRGLVEFEKALEINPNNPDLMVNKGTELCILGRFDEGIELVNQGINFNKHYPQWYFWHLGIACFAGHLWQDSIDAFIRMDDQNKDTLTYLVADYVQTGDLTKADSRFSELLQIDAEISLEEIEETHSYLAADTLKLLVDGISLLMNSRKPQDKIRIIKS